VLRIPLTFCELDESFGQPHAYTGLGIRKLVNKLFDCRGNRALRFIFQERPSYFPVQK
jgi:hypothetical protein